MRGKKTLSVLIVWTFLNLVLLIQGGQFSLNEEKRRVVDYSYGESFFPFETYNSRKYSSLKEATSAENLDCAVSGRWNDYTPAFEIKTYDFLEFFVYVGSPWLLFGLWFLNRKK
jgi:hypothetical protein